MTEGYPMAGQRSELERPQLQARLWEPAGRMALERLGDGHGRQAPGVGRGAMGRLRTLSKWAGPQGEVAGSDTGDLLEAARDYD